MKRFLLFMAGFLLRDAVETAISAKKKLNRFHELDDCWPDPNNPKSFTDELEWVFAHSDHFLNVQAKFTSNWEDILLLKESNFLRLWFYPVRYLKELKGSNIKTIRVRQGSEPLSASKDNKIKIEESFREYNVDEEIAKLI